MWQELLAAGEELLDDGERRSHPCTPFSTVSVPRLVLAAPMVVEPLPVTVSCEPAPEMVAVPVFTVPELPTSSPRSTGTALRFEGSLAGPASSVEYSCSLLVR